jgi:hypothetical protein
MPAHLLSVLSCQATIDFVTVCDFEVYQVRSHFQFIFGMESVIHVCCHYF